MELRPWYDLSLDRRKRTSVAVFDPLDASELLSGWTSYLLQGLNNQETVLLVAPADRTEAFMRMLQEQGADVEKSRRRNMLHTSDGMEDPVKQAAFISDVASLSGGRFRVLGDMLWTRSKGWSLEALRELEEMGNSYRGASGRFFLCQYPLDVVSGQETMMALETHNYAIFRGEIRKNQYFRQM